VFADRHAGRLETGGAGVVVVVVVVVVNDFLDRYVRAVSFRGIFDKRNSFRNDTRTRRTLRSSEPPPRAAETGEEILRLLSRATTFPFSRSTKRNYYYGAAD